MRQPQHLRETVVTDEIRSALQASPNTGTVVPILPKPKPIEVLKKWSIKPVPVRSRAEAKPEAEWLLRKSEERD